MASLHRYATSLFRVLKHRPWPLSTAVAPKLPLKEPIEEACTPYYDPARFYPAKLGHVLGDRYQLATKLGYGSNSTTWLARDLNQWRWQSEKYIALKINSSAHHTRENAAQTELDILRHVSEANPQHKGYGFVRRSLDSFTLEHGSAKHLCLVFEALREPLWIYRRRFLGDVIPSDILKILLQMILHGLDYLHSECRVIHTDLKPDNIMIKVEDPSILEESASDEHSHPLPQKTCSDGRTIYLSRNNLGVAKKVTGIIQITDFDLSVRGHRPNKGCIQAEIYRAPEVILAAGYSYSADIWSLGVMLWDLLEGKELFNVVDPMQAQGYDEPGHLARIAALLGPPPQDLLDNGARTDLFYTPDGEFKGTAMDPSIFNFENSLSTIQNKDKRMFIEFVRRMLKWRPEERSTAKELLQDPWLCTDADED